MDGQFIRVIRRKEMLALSFGAMIGWSWVALTGTWIAGAGSVGAILAFAAGGIVVIFVGLTYAELASAMPKAGGEHVYSKRALGSTASFVCTWAILLGYVSVVAFEAVALPTVTDYLLPGFSRGYLWTIAGWDVELTWVLVGVVAAIVMTAINVAGIRTAARLQLIATVLILLVGVLLLSGGVVNGSTGNMEPLFTDGAKGFLSVLIMVPFMFVGFDVIPQSAEEIDISFADIGKLLMLSIAMAVVWYVAMIWAVSNGLASAERDLSALPTADASAALLGGAWGGKLLVIGGIGGILTSWNAFLIGGSRAIYALARAGQLPASLGHLHPRFNTPHRAECSSVHCPCWRRCSGVRRLYGWSMQAASGLLSPTRSLPGRLSCCVNASPTWRARMSSRTEWSLATLRSSCHWRSLHSIFPGARQLWSGPTNG